MWTCVSTSPGSREASPQSCTSASRGTSDSRHTATILSASTSSAPLSIPCGVTIRFDRKACAIILIIRDFSAFKDTQLMPGNPVFMQQAIDLATESVTSGRGGPFGAVIVRDGDVLAVGSNLVTTSNDPTAHAEVVAIRNACTKLNLFALTGCDIYTSCEPCPMCLAAIYWARLGAVYYGNTAADAAAIGFDDAFLYDEI